MRKIVAYIALCGNIHAVDSEIDVKISNLANEDDENNYAKWRKNDDLI
jgi:hypothetical protein